MKRTKQYNNITYQQILCKYPRLAGHLICHSLGYMTPQMAANAIMAHQLKRPFLCEWYSHLSNIQRRTYEEINQEQLQLAFQLRHTHKSFMASYAYARQVIAAELQDCGPQFASWF